MQKAKLIAEGATWQQVKYSRCGRTDKGVSAAGQVCRLLFSASCIHYRLYQLNTTLSFPCTPHPAALISIASSCLCRCIDAVSEMLKQNESCSIKTAHFVHLCFFFCMICNSTCRQPDKAVCLWSGASSICANRKLLRHVCDAEAHALLLL